MMKTIETIMIYNQDIVMEIRIKNLQCFQREKAKRVTSEIIDSIRKEKWTLEKKKKKKKKRKKTTNTFEY